MELKDKTALVTGASRGIGFSIAKALSEQGAYVVGTATSPENAEKLLEKFKADGINGEAMALNVSSAANIEAFSEKLLEKFSAVDILVNNAAITRDNLFLRMKADEWSQIMDTNLNSIYFLTKSLIKPMVKSRWGRIVNISSVVGFTGNAGQTNYSAAKAGMVGFTKSLAQEIASRNITVNSVVPGFIETDMTRDLPEKNKEQLLSVIPMSRMGAPEDIANAVSFLCSPKASYITGVALHVNGGMFMA